jgi:hypothetical protein
MGILRTTILTVAGGLLLAVVLLVLTYHPVTWLGPIGRPVATDFVEDMGGTDPWTGEYRDRTWTYTGANGERVTRVFDLGPDYGRPWVIPLPVGFVAGCVLTLTIIAGSRRLRRTPSAPAIPAA